MTGASDTSRLDLLFGVDHIEDLDGALRVHCSADVGFGVGKFAIHLPSIIAPVLIERDGEFYETPALQERLTATLLRDGDATDFLIGYLRTWEITPPPKTLVARVLSRFAPAPRKPPASDAPIDFDVVPLTSETVDLRSQPAHLKLTYDGDDPVECFLSLDLKEAVVTLNEKDLEYRSAFLALMQRGLRAPVKP